MKYTVTYRFAPNEGGKPFTGYQLVSEVEAESNADAFGKVEELLKKEVFRVNLAGNPRLFYAVRSAAVTYVEIGEKG